jgi:hypothetical protein
VATTKERSCSRGTCSLVLAHCFCLRDAETKARVVFGLSGYIGDQNGGVAMLVRATVLCAVLAGALASGSVGVARAKTGVLPSPEVVFSPAEGANISAGVASDGADGVWFSDLEPSGAYLEHYAPGVTPSGVTVPTGEGLNWAASGMCRQVRLILPPSFGHRRRSLPGCVRV